ncbi:Hypothetical_protein [Hexamita inflata]|uniref:Hypothetical_protein n=1 Tax=Hexamita inflata TaxID=28002 RepID=A0AA86PYL1_9EUKA|nr:Hypothetical protein HINF_LOCUS35338 [Hexamita inflata]
MTIFIIFDVVMLQVYVAIAAFLERKSALFKIGGQVPLTCGRFASHVKFCRRTYCALQDRDAFVFVIFSGKVVALIRLNLRSMLVGDKGQTSSLADSRWLYEANSEPTLNM